MKTKWGWRGDNGDVTVVVTSRSTQSVMKGFLICLPTDQGGESRHVILGEETALTSHAWRSLPANKCSGKRFWNPITKGRAHSRTLLLKVGSRVLEIGLPADSSLRSWWVLWMLRTQRWRLRVWLSGGACVWNIPGCSCNFQHQNEKYIKIQRERRHCKAQAS